MSNADQSSERTVEFRGGGFAPKPKRWLGLLTFVILIAWVEIGTRTGFISNLTVPQPYDIFATFIEL